MGLFNYSIFLMRNGSVKSVGINQHGQLGLGYSTPASPYGVFTINDIPVSGIKAVANGAVHTMFLMNDGTVKAVGANNHGQLGLGNTTSPITAISDVPITGVKDISCGQSYTMFLMEDGSVKSVGYNTHGQLGLGNINVTNGVISSVPSLTGVKSISCGYYHTMFLMEDGTVKGVGFNRYGELGLGYVTTSPFNVTTISDVPNLTGVKSISCGGNNTMFLMKDGTVKAVGYNNYGQLGLGNTTNQSTIRDILISGVKSIVCGGYHTMFLMEDGSVKGVGNNQYGQLGVGNTTSPQLNISDVPITGVKSISCGGYHTMFLMNDGTVKGVGYNQHGQLGLGYTTATNGVISNIPNLISVSSIADSYTLEEIKKLLYLLKSKLNNSVYTPSNEEPILTELQEPLTTLDFETYGVEDLSLVIGNIDNTFTMSKIGELASTDGLETKQLLSYKIIGFEDIEVLEVKESETI